MAKNIKSSTQKFTEIEDIVDNLVILEGQSAAIVIEVQATNFSLLSLEEQRTKIYAYSSLLNSLSFPIQIVIKNKRIDISSYIKLLDLEVQKTLSPQSGIDNSQGEKLGVFIKKYRDFVAELVKINTVLDKKFYLVISFSALEKGVKGVINNNDFVNQAKISLETKSESIITLLARLSLKSRILEKEELIKLFYGIYNQEFGEVNQIADNLKTPIVKGQNI